MKLQLLVAAVNQQVTSLAEKMNISSDAIIINQGSEFAFEEYEHKGRKITCYSFKERGVGLNRNNALLRATSDIILFSDEDIVYEGDYEEKVLAEFERHPKADMILFNVDVARDRATYHISKYGRVRFYNCGRYPTYSFAIRRKKVHSANITFSLLFGGGAKYSNGEDSLFLHDCLKHGFKIYTAPIKIGEEIPRESTWFSGYNEKFFYDRGVLYYYLYGKMARLMAKRFLLKHQGKMCQEIPVKVAAGYMKKGICDGKH